jgi:hypothetical protein
MLYWHGDVYIGGLMGTKEILISEIDQIPEPLLDEMLDFARFLKSRLIKGAAMTALASESALKKDWLKAEEDEAWRDL